MVQPNFPTQCYDEYEQFTLRITAKKTPFIFVPNVVSVCFVIERHTTKLYHFSRPSERDVKFMCTLHMSVGTHFNSVMWFADVTDVRCRVRNVFVPLIGLYKNK